MRKISVITTVYNREKFLSAAIESVLAQTFTDFEYLIWDDGSTDKSVEIAKEYARKDARIKVAGTNYNQGLSKTLKDAIAATDSPYFGWVDSDDLLHRNALLETNNILDISNAIGFVYTDYEDIDESGKLIGIGKRCQIPYSKERLLIDFMTFHFRLIRRFAYDSVGGINQAIASAEDYDLCLKLSEVADVFHLPLSLYKYRHHNQTLTKQRQVDVILASEQAINDALVRRQLNYKADVQIYAKFSLVKA